MVPKELQIDLLRETYFEYKFYKELLYIEKFGSNIDLNEITYILVQDGYLTYIRGINGYANARLTFKGIFALFVCRRSGRYNTNGTLRIL